MLQIVDIDCRHELCAEYRKTRLLSPSQRKGNFWWYIKEAYRGHSFSLYILYFINFQDMH